MKIVIETKFDLPAMKALARGLRKTIRKKRSRRSHIFGCIVVALGAMLLLSATEINAKLIVTTLAVAAILLAFCFEDTLNALIALRRGIPGLHSTEAVFDAQGYTSKTEIGESKFYYENINFLAETKDYFLLIIGPNHGQVYSKAGIREGSLDALRSLLEERTGKCFETV